ncbi:MAG: hypothetical protein Q8N36_02295 [bacterium]|nr:hypothetical protein [bacterium]
MTINLIPQVAEIIKIPRVVTVQNSFGAPMGQPNDIVGQISLLKEALNLPLSDR